MSMDQCLLVSCSHIWDDSNNSLVDGGGWRTKIQPGSSLQYPEFLLSGDEVTGVAGGKKSKI
jgi:hypothetical protein